ncbi:MAG: flagellin [Gemmatimonadota bacterium]
MSGTINTNIAANNAYKNLSATGNMLDKSIQKLSSGFRINRSGDDAAGLAIANKLRSDVRSLQTAQRNASQANSMLQIADGAINTVATILDRMKELATQGNSSNIGAQAGKLQAEYQELAAEITRIAQTTKYNGTALVDGTFGNSVTAGSTAAAVANVSGISLSGAKAATYTFAKVATTSITLTQGSGVGAVSQTLAYSATATSLVFDKLGVTVSGTAAGFSTDALDATTFTVATPAGGAAQFMVSSSGSYSSSDLVSVNGSDLTATTLGVNALDLTTALGAQSALTSIDNAIGAVGTAIGTIGAAQSRIDFASTNVANLVQNTQAAESTIRDADMAYEMTQFTKNQILQQAGTAMLAQANQAPQSILKLLQ